MNALPNIYLTWDPSTESLDTFLRYQVYRRELGASEWTKLARITDRGVAYYNDYGARSGTTYEYAVTQVKDVAGEEVEGVFPAPVQAQLAIVSIFVHALASPSVYAELDADRASYAREQDIAYVLPASRRVPTPHVGRRRQRVVRAEMGDEAWDDSAEIWRAVEDLQEAQYALGSKLMLRGPRDLAFVAALESPERDDRHVAYGASLTLREVYHREEVD